MPERWANRPLDGSKSVFFIRLEGWDRFLVPLRPLLQPFLAARGAISGLLGINFQFVGAVVGLFSPSMFAFHSSIFVCSFSLFDLSMLHLGPALRTARLNPPPPEGSERV